MKKGKIFWITTLSFLIIIGLFLIGFIIFKYIKTQKFSEDKYGKCIDCNGENFIKQCYGSLLMKNNIRCCEGTFILETSNCDDGALY